MNAQQLTCTEFQLMLTTYLYVAHLTRPSEALRTPSLPFILPLKKINGGGQTQILSTNKYTPSAEEMQPTETLNNPITAHNNQTKPLSLAFRRGVWGSAALPKDVNRVTS